MEAASLQLASSQGVSYDESLTRTDKSKIAVAKNEEKNIEKGGGSSTCKNSRERLVIKERHVCHFEQDAPQPFTLEALSSINACLKSHNGFSKAIKDLSYAANFLSSTEIEKDKETGLLSFDKKLNLDTAWSAFREMQYCCSADDMKLAAFQLRTLISSKAFSDLESHRYSYPTHLRSDNLLKVVCSDILLSRQGSILIDFSLLDEWSLNQYIENLKLRADLYHKIYPFKTIELGLLIPLNSFWWKNYTPEQYTLRPNDTKIFSQYFYEHCIPHRLKGVLFKEHTAWSYPDALIHVYHHSQEPLGLRADKIVNGDEFEYWAGGESSQDKDRRIVQLLKQLDAHARMETERFNVTEKDLTTIMDCYPDDYERTEYRGKPRLTIRFGAWECVAHWDYWSIEPLFEINASPYKIDEQYTVNGKEFSVYDIYELFITSFARKVGLQPSSGHKHIDFHESIGGNPEYLFRLFVSAEQSSFLSHVFKTEDYSDSSNQYVCQSTESSCKIRALETMVNSFNKWLSLGFTGKSGDHFSVNECFRHFWSGLFSCSTSKYAPIGMRELAPLGMKREAELGKPCLPRNTLEFRFFNCARNGEEVKKINIFLDAWLKHIDHTQKERTYVEEYLPYDPKSKTMEESKVEEKFRLFLIRIGLDRSEFDELFW